MKARIQPNVRSFSIDPGLGGTGWADWRGTRCVATGVITPPTARKEPDWTRRVDIIGRRIFEILEDDGAIDPALTVYCEMMEYQASAKRSVAWKSGDLQMTVFLIGHLAGVLRPARFVPVLVREWKGQLPKDVVTRRIIQTLGADTCARLGIKTHAWDAVGIGLYSLGVWHD